ncbi:CCA tRNA nucleotidyltransferase [Gemmobacter nectariphilus]|uniref:CCA tRNA nucleotidyltransferase n=1 Tax=Gemmobacter nectariphilus TaxID=220343 RepID=UPI0003F9FF1D|nr:CCA tRNA nucleotidyltransferase [Gemmobacter nectariphilus]
MKIAGDWLTRSGTRALCTALEAAGHQALFVGGCVRNALLGAPVADLDIATDATPDQVSHIAAAARLKVVPTGIDHGTVTVIAGQIPHEVTTFRRDVETFGRHATVAFSDRIEEDAARRDFTMNALYARIDGTVIDPLDGLPDLLARRVRFVGDATARINEDYLRILRFFRFHAWYGDPANGPDPEALAAIAGGLDGLAHVSRERIGHEMRKLLAAPDPAPSLAAMQATGVLARILPGADARVLAPLVHLEDGRPPRWQRRLAALGGPAPDLRLSRAESAALDHIRRAMTLPLPEAAWRLGADAATDAALITAATLGQPLPADTEATIAAAAAARFPVTAADLLPSIQGAALGATLKRLESRWIASGFALDRAALLANDQTD